MISSYFAKILSDNNDQSVIRRGWIWNMVCSVLNAGMTAIVMFFIARIDRPDLIAYFSIATAVAYQCQSIAAWGTRNFHISDVKREYNFYDFLYLNIIMTFLALFILGVFSFGQSYSAEKSWTIFTYGIYRFIDIAEGVLYDDYQRQGRIDVGLILQTIRYLLSLICFIIGLMFFKNLIIANAFAITVSISIIAIGNKNVVSYFQFQFQKIDLSKVKTVLRLCTPIAITEFINIYLVNASRYAVDANGTDNMQALFAILIVPVSTISLISMVIYRPFITLISNAWCEKQYKKFKLMVLKQVCIILCLTIAIIVFGYFIGLELLGILYNSNLEDYMGCFILLLIGGGVNTLSIFLNTILIVIREQSKSMVAYIISAGITFLMSGFLINRLGLLGASILYILPSFVIVALNVIFILKTFHRNTCLFAIAPM